MAEKAVWQLGDHISGDPRLFVAGGNALAGMKLPVHYL